MLYNILDKWKLYKGRVGYFYDFIAFTRVKFDGGIIKDGEPHGTAVADNLNTVFAGGVVGNETPGARTRQSVLKTEDSTYGVFCLVDITTVGAYSAGIENDAEHLLKEIELMRCQIVEIATACDIWL